MSTARRTPPFLWLWVSVTLAVAVTNTAFLGELWLVAQQDALGLLAVGAYASAAWIPAVATALSAIIVAFIAIADELLGPLLIALGALACHVPFVLLFIEVGKHGLIW